MKNIIQTLIAASFVLILVSPVHAEKLVLEKGQKTTVLKQTSAGCNPSSAFEWLDINNIRARINGGGDMWWDLDGNAKYFIPKNGTATSMFSAALWIGGLDINNQLKLAAQRYRQEGNDFWTGPLTIDGTAAISEATCAEYDKHFRMSRAMVDEFLAHCDPNTGAFMPSEEYTIPREILEWPAHGNTSLGQSYYLAPFYDADGDGEYNPYAGDYPYYDIDNSLCKTRTPTMDESVEGKLHGSVLADQVIKGDQTIWWVFNDKGNFHSATQGSAIGMEIRAQAFGFATNDEINNMTFYSYEIINRSTFELTNTYFSQWVDPDLGYAWDDYVGCDIVRGLGYSYNGKAVDGSGQPEAYGDQPPAIGVDFFQGPYMDPLPNDRPKYRVLYSPTGDTLLEPLCDESINGINFGDGIPGNERFGMRRFLFHDNTSGDKGDPHSAPQYYNILRGKWKNGQAMSYGGDAFPGHPGVVGPECDFMFPGDTDPCNWGTGGAIPNGGYTQNGFYWREETGNNGAPNDASDRRFLHSAGPFTLKPGAVNYITVGIPWARATSGGPLASVTLLKRVDDKCQALFDNCFKVIDGPNAPDLSFRELDREVIVYISNSPSSNNYNEEYTEFDPNIVQPHPNNPNQRSDSLYRFEGYLIYQLKNATVSVESLKDPDLVRLVAQFDKKNGVSKIVNFYYDEHAGATAPMVEVIGGDKGIEHSFIITQDAFATGDVRLVNHQQYYYLALAYAYNEFMPYSDEPSILNGLLGQKNPFLAGRKNIKLYTVIPHKTMDGVIATSNYGDSPEITRLSGHGNGGLALDLSKATVDEILNKKPAGPDNPYGGPNYPMAYEATYKQNAGPLSIRVVDPLNVRDSDYEFWMEPFYSQRIYNVTQDAAITGDTASKMVSNWYLKDLSSGEIFKSDTTIITPTEKLFIERGISVTISQPYSPGLYRIGSNSDNEAVSTVLATNNGFLLSTVTYADSSRAYLTGIADSDQPPSLPFNWIRSGKYKDQENSLNDDWGMSSSPLRPWDPDESYEKIAGRTWAPYALVSYGNNTGESGQSNVGPAYSSLSKTQRSMSTISSVDIVLTPDKSKWTRSPVLEMGIDSLLTQGRAKRFALRKAPSVDKDGKPAASMTMPASENQNDPNYIGSYGMGWFPGYAINVETGERLNIMFGEDSYLSALNGRDMLFNPPPRNLDLPQELDPNLMSQTSFTPLFGGKHYVYIMRHDYNKFEQFGYLFEYNSPGYDAGRYAFNMLDTLFKSPNFMPIHTQNFFSQIMYVGMPMPVKGQEWLSNEVKIRIRVAKPYARYHSLLPFETEKAAVDNDGYPKYKFSLKGLATKLYDKEKMQSDLDLITVVPNPYYAYSKYENNALDNRVKITNLPKTCVITIYDLSGTKIRQFKKDEIKTSIDWDLKNFAGVPIASGVYVIHVKSDEGERIVKWFGTLRPMDLNTF